MAPSRTPIDDAEAPSGLTSEQLRSYHENGYLLIPGAIDPTTVCSLLAETNRMLSDFDLDKHPMTRFSTGTGDNNHVGDEYFLNSGDKIRLFFEEDAFSSDGNLTKPKHLAINKIGHYLHVLSPEFRTATLTQFNASIAKSLGFRDPRVLQSMVICKQPEIGGAVPPHQDSTFLYTNPPSAVGFWIALEDASVENGCLSFAAGSHKRAPVTSRFVRKDLGGTGFADVQGARFAEDIETEDRLDEKEVEGYTLAEVKAGTLVLIHGNLLHKSGKNLSKKGRIIYTFHVIEGEHEYDKKNWLQPPANSFTKLYSERD